MFKKLFNRMKGEVPPPSVLRAADPERWESELVQRIAEMSGKDPLIGAKIGGKEVAERSMAWMKTERGVHVESILGALGSLAGYACQASVRARARAQGLDETARFVHVEAPDGKTYFFGDDLNGPLLEDEYSVWTIAAGGAQATGCEHIPDPTEVFAHVAETVGSPEFGLPRLTPEHPMHDTPLNYVEAFWPEVFRLASRFCPDPAHWPLLLGLAVQEIMLQAKGVLDPCLALRIVMECAIPMSKIDRGPLGN